MSIRNIFGQELQLPPQQGWQCPVCKRVYSPITPTCHHCNNRIEQGEARSLDIKEGEMSGIAQRELEEIAGEDNQ